MFIRMETRRWMRAILLMIWYRTRIARHISLSEGHINALSMGKHIFFVPRNVPIISAKPGWILENGL